MLLDEMARRFCEARTLFVTLADLDDFVDVLFFERTSDDDEIILEQSVTPQEALRTTYLFFIWIAQIDNALLLDQSLRESRLALLAPSGSGRLDFLKARN
jgi:hypothetical protein